MPTNIYLANLNEPGFTINILDFSDYQSEWPSNEQLSSSEYSVLTTSVAAKSMWDSSNNVYNFPTFTFIQGPQIMSVNRDSGIKDGDTYYLNIPLQFAGDGNVWIVQLCLKGTFSDSDGWFGAKCNPVPLPGDPSDTPPSWDSAWYEFADSDGSYGNQLLPGAPTQTILPDQPVRAIGTWCVPIYAASGPTGGYEQFSLYLMDDAEYNGGDNDDLWIMITDEVNYPFPGGV